MTLINKNASLSEIREFISSHWDHMTITSSGKRLVGDVEWHVLAEKVATIVTEKFEREVFTPEDRKVSEEILKWLVHVLKDGQSAPLLNRIMAFIRDCLSLRPTNRSTVRHIHAVNRIYSSAVEYKIAYNDYPSAGMRTRFHNGRNYYCGSPKDLPN